MVFHKSHNKWIPKPFHYVNIHLSSPTHINEKLIWAYIQIFSSNRKISVKIFVENESIHSDFFQASLPFSNTRTWQSTKCVNIYLLRNLVSDSPAGFLSKNNTGALKMDFNILLCKVCEELTRMYKANRDLVTPKRRVDIVKPEIKKCHS